MSIFLLFSHLNLMSLYVCRIWVPHKKRTRTVIRKYTNKVDGETVRRELVLSRFIDEV